MEAKLLIRLYRVESNKKRKIIKDTKLGSNLRYKRSDFSGFGKAYS